MKRNKLPYIILVFASALLYVLGVMWGIQHKRYAAGLERTGEISLIISLIIFFAIPKKK